MVLNSVDTQNFIQLKDILSDILKGATHHEATSGDNYYTIDINVESIANDYDVDKLSNHLKEIITNDAMYRNVNAVENIR